VDVGGESRIFTRAISEINATVGVYRRRAPCACCNCHHRYDVMSYPWWDIDTRWTNGALTTSSSFVSIQSASTRVIKICISIFRRSSKN